MMVCTKMKYYLLYIFFYKTNKYTKSIVTISNNVNVVTLTDPLCKGLASGSSVKLVSFFFPYSVISCQVPTEIRNKKA